MPALSLVSMSPLMTADHWQPLQLNLPVKLGPRLRRFMATISSSPPTAARFGSSTTSLLCVRPPNVRRAPRPFLYEPETTIRVDSDGFPGTPLPPEEPTAENPPDGAILDYYLPTQATRIELRIFDCRAQAGAPCLFRNAHRRRNTRRFQSPSAGSPNLSDSRPSAGMHRFIWNLAWGTSGVTDSDEPDDGEGDIPRGPRVAPGQILHSNSIPMARRAVTRTLIVVKDPRSPASQAEMESAVRDQLQNLRGLAPERAAPWRRSVR